MKYIALFRGINVGKNKRVEMKKLKAVFGSLGFINVSTYINSGNIIFESKLAQNSIQRIIEKSFKKEFKFETAILVKTEKEMQKIAKAIPAVWKNDAKQRTDVAYLFKKADSIKIIDDLPVNKEFVDIRYVKGAVFWNIDRKNYNKSRLNKLIGCEAYQLMTIRNVNTARYLAGLK